MVRTSLLLPIASAALLAAFVVPSANAGVLVEGSPFTVTASNSPDTFTNSLTLTPGNHLIDGGSVNLNIALVPVGTGGAEWAVFNYTTVGGVPLSQPGSDWSVNEVGLDLAVKANFTGAYVQFNQTGTDLVPTSSIFTGYVVGANPVPGGTGTGFVASGFTVPFPSGPLPALGTFIDPFDHLNSTGINSADVNGYEEALFFAPHSPIGVPEPASLAVLATGLLGLAMSRRRRRA